MHIPDAALATQFHRQRESERAEWPRVGLQGPESRCQREQPRGPTIMDSHPSL